jgi:transcriptional regulator with XRE-family HTH domain
MNKVIRTLKEKGITQKDLAKKIGLSREHLNKVLQCVEFDNPGLKIIWLLYNELDFDFNIFDIKSYE